MDKEIPRRNQGSVTRGLIWMVVISILLFWLPVLGPLIAGFVGGRKAGTLGNAIMAVLLPAIVLGVLLLLFSTALTDMILIGVIAGIGGFVLAISQVVPLVIGAIIGGLFS
jgi:hypothetical protein